MACRSMIFYLFLAFGIHFSLAFREPGLPQKSDVLSGLLSNILAKVYGLENDVKILKNLNTRQQERLTEVEKHLAEEQSKKKSRSVGFSVLLTKPQTACPAVISFNKVIGNYGNGWNTVTHHFVAPRKGMYLFYLSFLNVFKVRTWAEIRRGNTRVTKSYTYGDSYNSGSSAAVLELQKGDHVSAWLMDGQLHENSWAHFVGVLINS